MLSSQGHGRARKGKERKGKERKGKERKGKDKHTSLDANCLCHILLWRQKDKE
jgi:hypothetical protein